VLGAQLADEHGRVSQLEREAESLRQLSEVLRATGASFEKDTVVLASLNAAVRTLGAAGAALGTLSASGEAFLFGVAGRDLSPLANDPGMASILERMLRGPGTAVIEDLAVEVPEAAEVVRGLRALAVVPVEPAQRTSLVVAMRAPDGTLSDSDVRFLANIGEPPRRGAREGAHSR
jgi:hypothetical protein